MGEPEDRLAQLRAEIDAMDARIVDLLNERAKVVLQIAAVKQDRTMAVYSPQRERAVLDRIKELNRGPLPAKCLEAVYREVMSGSFALARTLRVGFLGPHASFSEYAASRHFGSSVEYVPLSSIAAVFDEVARGRVDHGVVPYENTIHGGIAETLDAIVETSATVCAEVRAHIHHNVLAREPWEKIRRIHSKAEIFHQCRKWLAATARHCELVSEGSSSRAAELAASEPGSAAICSRQAGELYGLSTLFDNIEDRPDNVTRFLVLGTSKTGRTGDDSTALTLITSDKPGALAAVLDVFRDRNINLTNLEKRPSRTTSWQYRFFIDADGHVEDESVKEAIAVASEQCVQLRVIGSYPRAKEVF